MAWRYCEECGSPVDQPTLADAIAGEQYCDCCEHVHYLADWEKRHAAEAVTERLEELEKRLGVPE